MVYFFQLVGSFMPESTTTKKESNSENWYDSDADRYGIKKPGYFIGSISDIMKKIPSSMQITRVSCTSLGVFKWPLFKITSGTTTFTTS